MDERRESNPGQVTETEGSEAAPRGVRAAAVVRWGIVAAVGLVAVVTVYHALFDGSAEAQPSVRYQCPMHPEIVQDHPGDCPICGMTLVPVAEEVAEPHAGGAEHGAHEGVPGLADVTLSSERLQASGIRTARVARKTLDPTVRALGLVSEDERRIAEVTARVPGWVRGASLVVGDRVRRGRVLASIESPDVLALTRELVAVRRLGGSAGLGADDFGAPVRQRLELLGLPRAAIDRVERSGRAVGVVPLVSPVGGHVTERGAIAGTYVGRGAPLYRIADLSTVWIQAEVYARDIARITVGQEVDVALEGDAAPSARGRVAHVYPVTDAGTRTTRVRVELPNPDLALRPGLFAEVAIHGEPVEGLVVPTEAIADTGDRQWVFVAHEGGRFEPRAVRVGPRVGEEAIVEEGLSAGEEVVSSGAFLLDSESRIRAAIAGRGREASHEGHAR